MKKVKTALALTLGSLFAVSSLAACGGGKGGDDTPEADAQAPVFSNQAVTLELNGNAGSSPRRISDSLFGVFLEDINYAGYLLDDNLLINGSFETYASNKAEGWIGIGGASLSVKNTDGVLKNVSEYGAKNVNANYAEVKVNGANGGISNAGHPNLPIAVENGKKYVFSAFIRTTVAGNMTVRVQGSETYAEEAVQLKAGAGWVKYQLTLTASGTADKNLALQILFDTAGTYEIDGVQLETTDSTVGIKQYVYNAIAELSPKFIRFPGGCIIEGDGGNGGADTQEVYDWKNSIGAVQNGTNAGDDTIPAFTYTLVKDGAESTETTYGEWITRKQNEDLWGNPPYDDMEYGVGFYEYFLLCDSVGASAVPVLNCGLSCQGGGATNPTALNGRHGKKVADYIQDAVNLIEFAKGDKNTKWGALRAAMGHEKPFEMDYLGIGNEQSGSYYKTYYEEFLKNEAFKNALSEYSVKPIVGNGMFLSDCEKPDLNVKGTAQNAAIAAKNSGVVDTVADYGVHDQHYYVNWTKLLDNYEMYDGYARPNSDPENYYEVFVGEYSANDGDGKVTGYPLYANSLITALAEAAMMTSYERNGDIIKLAAYAPMFANYTGGRHWGVDMMYYTNTQIVRTANYYVQQIFMQNQGDIVLRSSKLSWKTASTFEFASEVATATAKEFNKIYFVTSKTDEGDLLVKLVNVSGEAIKLNVDISNATSKGFAYVTELSNADYKVTNELDNERVAPVVHSIGWSGESFGYELKPYSLTVFRVLTK